MRAFALLALLVASSVLMPARAEDSPPTPPTPEPAPSLCFDRDPKPPSNEPPTPPDPNAPPDPTQQPDADLPKTPKGKECPGGFPDVPNYLQGERIAMRLENLPSNSQPYVRVTCEVNCHEIEDTCAYYGRWRARALVFPEDFNESKPTEETAFEQCDPKLDKVPRYNSTWRAVALIQGAQISRDFNVWLFSLYRSRGLTVQPGEEHDVRSSGFAPSGRVDFRIERMLPNGSYERIPLPSVPTTADGAGVFRYVWRVPKDEVSRIAQCPPGHQHDCYRMVVRGSNTDKEAEIIPFRTAPAELIVTVREGQATARAPAPGASAPPEDVERTRNLSFSADVRYPGGRLFNGPPLTPMDLPGPSNDSRVLRVRVEKIANPNDAPVGVSELTLLYDHVRLGWRGTWTVPRDIALQTGAVYRVILAETRDQWGNHAALTFMGNYTISAARLRPELVLNLTSIERTEEGAYGFVIRYHNGTPFTSADNLSELRGCFVREPGDGTQPVCTNTTATPTTPGTYEDGKWVFRVRYPRDYDKLGAHRFILLGGDNAKDKWGNVVNDTRTELFDVRAASPRVDLKTVQRGVATDELERGERIAIQATITYADGRPFNHTVRHDPRSPWASVLNVTVTRRGSGDAIQGVDVIGLQEIDAERGLWVGTLDLTLDVQRTPIGRWSFQLRANDTVAPIPNVNDTEFERTVVAAPIRFEPLSLSPVNPHTGSSVSFSFKLRYPGTFGSTGPSVPPDSIRNNLYGQVYRWDATDRTAYGDPLSGFIEPEHHADRGLWVLTYQVPGNLFNGSFVFVMRGADTSGNKLPQDAWSRAFSPISPTKERQVLTQPPISLQRGDVATVVFAAQDGDLGPDGTGAPLIRVERWNAEAARWDPVVGGTDVRQGVLEINDHLGVFPITTTTAIGRYRFVLLGREGPPSLAIITNASANFTVEATEVTRAIYMPPPTQAVKGSTVHFTYERQEGDRVLEVKLLLNGRETTVPRPMLAVDGDQINGTWKIPFDAPNGNYTTHIVGRDQYGNVIILDTPSVELVSAALAGKIIGQPPRIVERGASVGVIFGITYPSGAFYSSLDVPSVTIYNDTAVVAAAEVVRVGLTFVANWTAPSNAEVADYWFEISGAGANGNTFPTLRSSTFRLAPGTFEREGAGTVPHTDRSSTVTYAVPSDASDRDVKFELAYFGLVADVNSLVNKEPLTLSPLPHALDPTSGRYTARFVTDASTLAGAYEIRMTGEDRLGNTITSTSNIFLLKGTTIVITFDEMPKNDAFKEGALIEFSFVARYKNGAVFDETFGRPGVALLLDGRPTTQRPDVTYSDGRWHVSFQIPDTLRDGEYMFTIGGQDVAGNVIANMKSPIYVVKTSPVSSFAKVIPGPDAGMLVLAAALVALGLAVARKKRAP